MGSVEPYPVLGMPLDYLLAKSAAARGLRWIEQLCAQSSSAHEAGTAAVDVLARCAAAMLELERVANIRQDEAVDLCGLLNRVATLVQLAAPGGSTMATSVAAALVPAEFARGVTPRSWTSSMSSSRRLAGTVGRH